MSNVMDRIGRNIRQSIMPGTKNLKPGQNKRPLHLRILIVWCVAGFIILFLRDTRDLINDPLYWVVYEAFMLVGIYIPIVFIWKGYRLARVIFFWFVIVTNIIAYSAILLFSNSPEVIEIFGSLSGFEIIGFAYLIYVLLRQDVKDFCSKPVSKRLLEKFPGFIRENKMPKFLLALGLIHATMVLLMVVGIFELYLEGDTEDNWELIGMIAIMYWPALFLAFGMNWARWYELIVFFALAFLPLIVFFDGEFFAETDMVIVFSSLSLGSGITVYVLLRADVVGYCKSILEPDVSPPELQRQGLEK